MFFFFIANFQIWVSDIMEKKKVIVLNTVSPATVFMGSATHLDYMFQHFIWVLFKASTVISLVWLNSFTKINVIRFWLGGIFFPYFFFSAREEHLKTAGVEEKNCGFLFPSESSILWCFIS